MSWMDLYASGYVWEVRARVTRCNLARSKATKYLNIIPPVDLCTL